MDNGSEAVDRSQSGKLILISIPTKETEEMVVSYLARKVRNAPAEKLARKIRKTPSVLSKDIDAKKGQTIAHNLRDLGARAEFVPHDPGSPVSEGLSGEASLSEIETIQVISEQQNASQQIQPRSLRAGKKVMTAMVVILLIAVFSLLIWQLYHLLTTKIFQ